MKHQSVIGDITQHSELDSAGENKRNAEGQFCGAFSCVKILDIIIQYSLRQVKSNLHS